VRGTLSIRETSDFDLLGRVAEMYARPVKDAQGLEKLALQQEANRNSTSARLLRNRFKMDLPDDDAILESVTGLIRGKKPHFEMAQQRLAEVLKYNPANADAWLLKLEAFQRADADKDTMEAAIAEAIEKAPVPELFHQVVSFYVQKRARGKATAVLERAIELLPEESRLRTRLAALLLRQGRRKEAIDHLRRAMELDPMLPDAYGLLGTAKRDEGAEALDEAEQLLREAVRLAPEDATQIARLVDLMLARAGTDPARRDALLEEAKAFLEIVLKSERKTADAYLLYAQLLREEGKDVERAAWMLKKAKKLTERGHERNARIVLEGALQAMRRGELDVAEKDIRELAQKDPSNDRVFAALAQILEAKQLFIPAHAEYLRARERTPKASLERARYDAELARLQALIEAQVATMVASGEVQAVGETVAAPQEPSLTGHQRVIRRRRSEGAAVESLDEAVGGASEEAAAEGEAQEGEAEAAPEGDDGEGGGSRHLYDDAEPDAQAEGEGAEAASSPEE
jgi:tetratricopeptide (TPR) repeat protein